MLWNLLVTHKFPHIFPYPRRTPIMSPYSRKSCSDKTCGEDKAMKLNENVKMVLLWSLWDLATCPKDGTPNVVPVTFKGILGAMCMYCPMMRSLEFRLLERRCLIYLLTRMDTAQFKVTMNTNDSARWPWWPPLTCQTAKQCHWSGIHISAKTMSTSWKSLMGCIQKTIRSGWCSTISGFTPQKRPGNTLHPCRQIWICVHSKAQLVT